MSRHAPPPAVPAASILDTLRGQSLELRRAYIWVAIGWGMIALTLWAARAAHPILAPVIALICTVIALSAAWRALGLSGGERRPLD